MRETLERHGKTPSNDLLPKLVPLVQGELFYWNAFQQLSDERQVGEILGAIPWSKVQAYAIQAGITDEDDRDDFEYVIREVDLAFREQHATRMKQEREAATFRAKMRAGGRR